MDGGSDLQLVVIKSKHDTSSASAADLNTLRPPKHPPEVWAQLPLVGESDGLLVVSHGWRIRPAAGGDQVQA
jgi:hypothetical protein